MRILIGYDGSVDADGALHDLDIAGLPKRATVLVVAFATPWEPFGPDGQIPMAFGETIEASRSLAVKEASTLARKAATYLRRRFPGWKVESEGDIHQPALGILERAEQWKPDLLVLGSHGRTSLDRLLLGSVSQAILHHAPCSVRVTRPRIRLKQGPPRLMVGVDGSADAEAAVAGIAERAWPKGTEVRVVGVLGTRLNPGVLLGNVVGVAYEPGLDEVQLTYLEEKVAAAVEKLAKAGLKAEPSVVSGDPRSDLLQEARNWAADCLFVGCRGMGAVKRFLLGSVSSAVAAHAACTVEVVRPAAKAKAGKVADRAAGKTADRAAGKTADRAAGKTADRAAGKAAGRTAGKTAGSTRTAQKRPRSRAKAVGARA